ncbi:MAG: transcriptional repressor LexA, partial [Chloroflexi bacterium]|nr:transcriptional repressor LexA [Chloroflexota bacterium]
VGRVAAGAPLLATENVEGHLDLGAALAGQLGNRFALQVRGQSMIEAGIMDGDYIVVRLQPTAENGDIVVALIGDEATVKFFFLEEDRVRLQPANSSMQPLYLKHVTIIGKVVATFRAYEPGTYLQGE